MTWSGSEQVASRMAALVDADDVFTFTGLPELIDRVFPGRRVHTSSLQRWPLLQRRWSYFLPVLPMWWRSLDMSAYDLVVTCSHSAVNSIRPRPGAWHVSYCCTPMRYAWNWRSEVGRVPRPLRPVWPVVAALLRSGDRRRSRRVDVFLAVSHYAAERIRRAYGRDAIVVHPPVDTEFFTPDPSVRRQEFFLYAGRLVSYKEPDVALAAAESADVRLVVAGSGPELSRLKRKASDNVTFIENPSDAELRDLYRSARALVFPGVEDFGMVMVEAQACGTPVIARREGGACEAVIDGSTGVLYEGHGVEPLAGAIKMFDRTRFDPFVVRANAERFSRERFDDAFQRAIDVAANTVSQAT